jgi:hypothetical protein
VPNLCEQVDQGGEVDMSNPHGRNGNDRPPVRGTCACGAPAVDRFQGVLRCAACLCPPPSAEYLARERHFYVVRGEGNLSRAMGSGPAALIPARDVCRAIEAAWKKRGLALTGMGDKYSTFGALEGLT